jgi:hydrogenase maturation protein HypF
MNSPMHTLARTRITIRGAVQGVGFRPFVYRLANELRLGGWVSNSSDGVHIEAEGTRATLDEFLLRLSCERPRHASIHSFEHAFRDVVGFTRFEIRDSDSEGPKRALILPDISTCADCVAELFNPRDRRYRYPFINCTNCGPRFTIIERLPYDRAHTTMRHFEMCALCRAEYEDPLDRRFHAQPNACPACGPHLQLWNSKGRLLVDRQAAILGAVDALNRGAIVAVKGLGGFHLMVDATDESAVVRLRQRKQREDKPFAVMVPSLEIVREMCLMNPLEERALTAPEAPIVILSSRHGSRIAPSVAPHNPYLGVMLPYTPLHHILLRDMQRTLVATSGNRSDEPIAIDEHDAIRRLGEIADLFLVHDRAIRRHADDSILRIILGGEQMLRRARGYAPLPVLLKNPVSATLGVGGHLKNTVALAIENNVFVSQHIGDLQTKEAVTAFGQVIDDFEKLYDARARRIACDAHPDYISTQHASDVEKTAGLAVHRVQHHYAHILSCMAENAIDAPALGVAWDGSGYGPDGTIWGGEFLLIRPHGFQRLAHLRTFPLPGGDAAVKKPIHSALGLLYEILGADAFTGREPKLLRQMLQKSIRCPKTSSAGRLFDAVASLVGIRDEVRFEGQAAIELEFAASRDVNDCYDYVIREGQPRIIDWEPMIRQILHDGRAGVDRSRISARFHNTLVAMILEIARHAAEPRVVLSGGCFQNRYLTEQAVEKLRRAGFSAYWHQRIPTNDGGLSLGQVMAAQQNAEQEKLCVLQSQAR